MISQRGLREGRPPPCLFWGSGRSCWRTNLSKSPPLANILSLLSLSSAPSTAAPRPPDGYPHDRAAAPMVVRVRCPTTRSRTCAACAKASFLCPLAACSLLARWLLLLLTLCLGAPRRSARPRQSTRPTLHDAAEASDRCGEAPGRGLTCRAFPARCWPGAGCSLLNVPSTTLRRKNSSPAGFAAASTPSRADAAAVVHDRSVHGPVLGVGIAVSPSVVHDADLWIFRPRRRRRARSEPAAAVGAVRARAGAALGLCGNAPFGGYSFACSDAGERG